MRVIRLNRHTPVGRAFADREGLSLVPGAILYDGKGEPTLRLNGKIPTKRKFVDALEGE